MRAIGLMSGTSGDGIDVALIETDGATVARFGPSAFRPYDEFEESWLWGALEAAADEFEEGPRWRDMDPAIAAEARATRPGVIAEAEQVLTESHAKAVNHFIDANGIDRATVDVIGFHGQTVLHRPEKRLTIQIGDGAALARATGISVVYDFRAADVAAGGQGAPFVPVYHRALARELDRPHPIAVLNLGGVANITYIDGENDPIACDTGPANALIDDFMRERTKAARDEDGAAGAMGAADEATITQLLAHPFFFRPAPKSLDRNDFRTWVAEHAGLADKSTEDGAATLTMLTAASVARVVAQLPRAPKSWIAVGGGASNPTLMRMLAAQLAPAVVETGRQVGWSEAALEAQAFAFLAVRSLRGLPLTFPSSTGAPQPMTGGVLVKPT